MIKRFVFRRTMRRWFICSLCVTLTVGTDVPHAFAQTDLPPEVRADILQRKILESARTNDLNEILTEIDEYKSLKVAISPALLLVEAKAAHRIADPVRAFTALKAFLAVGQRGSKGYAEALALYSEFEKEAAPVLRKAEESKQQAERDRLASVAKANQEQLEAEKKKLLGDIASGLVTIPGGHFLMGSPLTRLNWAQPAHDVEVKGFKVARKPITCEQFRIYILDSGKAGHDQCEHDYPLITWIDANGFIEWISRQTGIQYRLPSEAEWEWIVRNRRGPSRTSVSYNTQLSPRAGLGLEVEFELFLAGFDDQPADAKITGLQPGEWVADCEHTSYERAPADGIPWGSNSGNCPRRVLRGAYLVGKTMHRALIANNANYWTYDDSAFVAGRAFGQADEVCGGLRMCSFRVGLDQ